MKYKRGSKVKISSGDGVYSTYLQWICENRTEICTSLPHWVYDREMDASDLTEEWTVIYSGAHLEDKEDTIVFIDNGEKSFMINENYLVSVSKDDSNCDAKDILKQLVTLIEGNKELLEKAKKILESV